MSPYLHRVILVVFGLGGLLAGCETVKTLQLAYRAETKKCDLSPTRDQIDTLPYSQLFVKIGDACGTLILGDVRGEDWYWYSSDKTVLVTRNGLVVKTIGFGVDRVNTVPLNGDLFRKKTRLWEEGNFSYIIDFTKHYGITVHAEFVVMGQETIEIVGKKFDTLHLTSEQRTSDKKWTFTDHYWVDVSSGFIWKSIQHTAPGLPAHEIQVLKVVGNPVNP